jgi:hypothetical protein
MKKILIALLFTPLLMVPMLSFSVQAEDTPPLTTSSSDNVPNGGNQCTINQLTCSLTK